MFFFFWGGRISYIAGGFLAGFLNHQLVGGGKSWKLLGVGRAELSTKRFHSKIL